MNDQTRLINDVAIKLAKIRFSQKLKQSPIGVLFMDENGYIDVDDIINMNYYGLALTGDAISRLPLDFRGHVVKVIRFDFWESDDELEVQCELQVVIKPVAPNNVTVTRGLIYTSDDKPMLLEEGQWWIQQCRTRVSTLSDVVDIMVYTLEALNKKD
jgi:hypothetical protein